LQSATRGHEAGWRDLPCLLGLRIGSAPAEAVFLARVAEIGAMLASGPYCGSGTKVPLICARGHSCNIDTGNGKAPIASR